MPKIIFEHMNRGNGRPQILLIGNGVERCTFENKTDNINQMSWEKVIEKVCRDDSLELSEETAQSLPFPLLYEIYATPDPAPTTMSPDAIKMEAMRWQDALKELKHGSNPLMDRFPFCSFDHIFTTNYSYCLEKAFYPHRDVTNPAVRKNIRRCTITRPYEKVNKRTGEPEMKEICLNEQCYKMHTCYVGSSEDPSGEKRSTGLWHIHGECGVNNSVVLGHDMYGRLLSRIVTCCQEIRYSIQGGLEPHTHAFTSWPELFLFGDVYVLGFGFDICESDLWWLLRRKQREVHGDGKVYFYDRSNHKRTSNARRMLLKANGVQLINLGPAESRSYSEFYFAALDDICEKMKENRSKGV